MMINPIISTRTRTVQPGRVSQPAGRPAERASVLRLSVERDGCVLARVVCWRLTARRHPSRHRDRHAQRRLAHGGQPEVTADLVAAVAAQELVDARAAAVALPEARLASTATTNSAELSQAELRSWLTGAGGDRSWDRENSER
jgi:hypothetical protein